MLGDAQQGLAVHTGRDLAQIEKNHVSAMPACNGADRVE